MEMGVQGIVEVVKGAVGVDRIAALNVPKGGTWLLARCIELLTGRVPPQDRFEREGVVRKNQLALWSLPAKTLRECLRLREGEYLVGAPAAHRGATEDARRGGLPRRLHPARPEGPRGLRGPLDPLAPDGVAQAPGAALRGPPAWRDRPR